MQLSQDVVGEAQVANCHRQPERRTVRACCARCHVVDADRPMEGKSSRPDAKAFLCAMVCHAAGFDSGGEKKRIEQNDIAVISPRKDAALTCLVSCC